MHSGLPSATMVVENRDESTAAPELLSGPSHVVYTALLQPSPGGFLMADELTDADLIDRLQHGDMAALGLLYERHRPMVYHAALNVTRDPQAAEDVVHDCFLRVYRYASSFDKSRPVEPWLYWVAVHRACDWHASGRRWPDPLDPLVDRLPAPNSLSPESQAEKREADRRVREALSSLGRLQRDVMVLYYFHSHSLREIAHMLDCPIGTVKSRLYYGRENLCQAMEHAPGRENYDAL
jgi:RNA polymerase sigma-70 factor (ECF subfamily)